MQLLQIVSSLTSVQLRGGALDGVEIASIAYDSRCVEPGALFVALAGAHVDGLRFAPLAIAAGAVAVLCERAPDDETVPYLVVPEARAAMADAAVALYGDPSARLDVVGVTGTDGKTTTSFLVHALLRGTGHPTGLLSTVTARIGAIDTPLPLHHTTPESGDLQRLLREMVDAGLTHAVVETSSHALALERVRGCSFNAGIVTNITPEHLDFHRTMEEYREAKARLLRVLDAGPAGSPVAILNRDDPSFDLLRAASAAPVLSFGRGAEAMVRAVDEVVTASGVSFRALTPAGAVGVRSPLTGAFNVMNLLAALSLAVARGIDLQDAAAALETMRDVPGRMQKIAAGQPFNVVVDFAHTPDALAKALDTLRAVTPPPGKLIAVFGAEGERDPRKRRPMGRAAAQRCDLVIVTTEDPRSEKPEDIASEIVSGARDAGARENENLFVVLDRTEAIAMAVASARPGDTVVLGGKGHEPFMHLDSGDIPWDEAQVARDALAARGYTQT